MVIFHSYVSLPEGNFMPLTLKYHLKKHVVISMFSDSYLGAHTGSITLFRVKELVYGDYKS